MAAVWVDFALIKKQVGIADILRHYNLIADDEDGEQLKISCPNHEDSKPSLSVNTSMNAFKCFGACKQQGSMFAFVRMMEGIDSGDRTTDDRAAGKLMQEWFELEPKQERPAARAKPKPVPPSAEDKLVRKEDSDSKGEKVNSPLSFAGLKDLDPTHPYLKDRGLEAETVEYFEAGFFSGRGLMANRIAIPIFNAASELVAYVGRWPGSDTPAGEGKWKLPPKFHASVEVFNLHRVAPTSPDEIVVVEGFFDVLALWQEGVTDTVAIMGSQLSATQEQLILGALGSGGHIVLAFDDDEAGRHCTDDALVRFGRHVLVRATTYQALLAESQGGSS